MNNYEFNNFIAAAQMEGAREASGLATGKGTGRGASWLMAIAQAMGEAQGKLAAKMVAKSEEINAASDKAGGTGKEAEAAAMDFQKAMTEFQALSQLFSMTSNASSTAMKSIGEGMTAVARKS